MGKAIGQFLLQPNTIGGELELRSPAGYTRSVGDMGLKGIGIYDNSGRITSRIDVLGKEHYGIQTPHTSDYSWTWSDKAPGDGWWADELRPTSASPLNKLLIFLLS